MSAETKGKEFAKRHPVFSGCLLLLGALAAVVIIIFTLAALGGEECNQRAHSSWCDN